MPPTGAPIFYRAEGLADAWDGSALLRARAREHGKLLLHPRSQKVAANTVQNAILNKEVLAPTLVRLRVAHGKMPAVDDVIDQCGKVYENMGREVEIMASSKDGWSLRHAQLVEEIVYPKGSG